MYCYLGEKPTIANWQGCPIDMNSKMPDRMVSQKLAEKCGFKFSPFDVTHDFKSDYENIALKFPRYGEYSLIYCGNTKWYEIFENSAIEYYDFGYFGETIKGWEPLDEQFNEGFSIDDYVKLYLKVTSDKTDLEFEEYVGKKIIAIAKRFGMDMCNLSKEDCMILYYVYRIHADTVCSNFANIFGYSSNIFAEKEIIDFINKIPYAYKKDEHFNLLVTKILNEELLDIPYFTHCEYKKYNKEKMLLEDVVKHNKTVSIKKKILQTSIGKHLRTIKRGLKNAVPSERNNFKNAAKNMVSSTIFSTVTGIDLDKETLAVDVMLYEMPGWAFLLQDVLVRENA